MRSPRRAFLQRAAVLAAAAFARAPLAIAREAPRFPAYPFALGVASGSPRARSIVLWTRLAPLPLQGGGMFRRQSEQGIPLKPFLESLSAHPPARVSGTAIFMH